jgi:hypothetical protein
MRDRAPPQNLRAMRIDITWRNAVLFLLAAFLFGQAHEFSHHLSGRAVCGAWGEMSFGLFAIAACPAELRFLPTLIGPLFTNTLILLGAWLVLRGATRPGLLLVFANLPLGRIASVLTRGDELVVANQFLAPTPARAGSIALTLLVLGPALAVAWRGMARGQRSWLFPVLLLLPLASDALSKRAVLEPWLQRVQASQIAGVPWPVLAIDTALLLVLVLFRLLPRRAAAQARTAPAG